jgi:hypothetical protein
MRYTKNDIPKISIYKLLEAIGMKHVDIVSDDVLLYYTPYRKDPEPKFLVDDLARKWFDQVTGKTGDIRDLARLIAKGSDKDDIDGYIVRKANEYEKIQELRAMSRRLMEPETFDVDYDKIRLTTFMKALGQPEPLMADGNIFYYNAPYSNDKARTIAVNTTTNHWHDTKTKEQGNIFSLVWYMIGSSNISEIKRYISAEISAMNKSLVLNRNELEKMELPKKKGRMRL